MKILNKLSFGAGPRLPTERCGKTNCSNNARLNCVGIACPRWLPAIPAPQKIGFYPIWGQRLKTQLHGGFQANLAPWKNAQPVVVFLTNQTNLPAATVCDLYKARWQVELFFKWIKQHLRIKRFYGTSENAVKTQIWIAVSVYVLVAIVRKRLNLEASLYTILQVVSVSVFEKTPLRTAFSPEAYSCGTEIENNRLNLFTN